MNPEATERLKEEIADLNLPQTLQDWLFQSEPASFFRVNLANLAEKLNTELTDLVSHFLWMVDRGIFNLSWEYHCPHCNAVPNFHHNMSELKATGFCPLCDLTFRGTLDKNIEVTFTIHSAYTTIPPEIEENYKNEMFSRAKEGKYVLTGSYLSGLQCMNNPVFHTLFGDQVLSTEESLEIQFVTILFTDIKGSTAMYTELGDTRSYEIVREHFKILFQAVEASGGYVVKTIGDSVMASFLTPLDAIKAATLAYIQFREISWESMGNLEIKMGMHSGSVITVNMNDRIDYFGNTVNTAARIESKARDHSVCFSGTIFERKEIKRFIMKELGAKAKVYHRVVKLKGVSDHYDIYTLRLDR